MLIRTAYATLQGDDDSNGEQRFLKSTDAGAALDPQSEGGVDNTNAGKDWKPSSLAPPANKIRTRAADGTPMIYVHWNGSSNLWP